MTVDDFDLGVRDATMLAHDEAAREYLLRTCGWMWSEARLRGFLLIHEQHTRNARCTCWCCPVHRELEAPAREGSN